MPAKIHGQADFSIQDIVRYLLDETGTRSPPTRAQDFADYLGLSIRGFFHEEHGVHEDVRAYLLPANREIGISYRLSSHRRKFSILHEVGHFVIPGHTENLEKDAMFLDDDQSLADHSVLNIEMEANRFAADCIFQLDRLQTDVANVDMTWHNICAAASDFDTSVIATARRWVESSRKACALLVFVPVKLRNAVGLRYSYAIASVAFRQKFFARLSEFTLYENSITYRAYRETRGHADLVETLKVMIDDRPREFSVELFSTQYGVYGLIVE